MRMIGTPPHTRCGIDRVEIARVERLLRETPRADLLRLFAEEELTSCDGNALRDAASIAARFAAKEACLKLFPHETALGTIGPGDFSVVQNGYGAPRLAGGQKLQDLLDRYRLRAIALSLSHDATAATAVAVAEPAETTVPFVGRLLYHLLPIRRHVVLANLRRVFDDAVPEAEIIRIAQAHYAHLARVLGEFLLFPWLSPTRRAAMVRVENIDAILRVSACGKGVLVLAGHFGNWECATAAGIGSFPEYHGRLHILRRPLPTHWLDRLVTRRFRRAGLGVLPKRGSLDEMLRLLEAGDAVVFVMDQHAAGRDGVVVNFFGHPAGTFRSLAIVSLSTGVPVVPLVTWRGPDGHHVVRFEEALPIIECGDPKEAILANTRAYNAALERFILRHPEQWFWMHRRWKEPG
jgi:phosphopantetheine--protein transferase-like protein